MKHIHSIVCTCNILTKKKCVARDLNLCFLRFFVVHCLISVSRWFSFISSFSSSASYVNINMVTTVEKNTLRGETNCADDMRMNVMGKMNYDNEFYSTPGPQITSTCLLHAIEHSFLTRTVMVALRFGVSNTVLLFARI